MPAKAAARNTAAWAEWAVVVLFSCVGLALGAQERQPNLEPFDYAWTAICERLCHATLLPTDVEALIPARH